MMMVVMMMVMMVMAMMMMTIVVMMVMMMMVMMMVMMMMVMIYFQTTFPTTPMVWSMSILGCTAVFISVLNSRHRFS